MVTDGSEAYCGTHFAAHTNIELLCCTLEINIMIYVPYSSILKIIKNKGVGTIHI